ncbi:ABC-type phosphate transport system, substrate-binding protein [Yoonia tamlensis]|uniref:ABC-type phosphate transport system, substrate-binding protein n=1 Tax=Yoonia tamlensis TaxID=390270 RepID=A0A1I6FNS1_9RHOB|nr:substrate-binding domain-containing protein [Yoonia tamlensis]SFR31589.1 ABC-type phosphate transport system, substrate-binding protein [Yoonia tamlensis]
MMTLKSISATLLCMAAPAALFAEPVELRSIDGFISVDGEIVGYNGTMVSVETSVGRVSVPASEVVCYGTGCDEAIASNDFGLTRAAFRDVVTQSEVAVVGGSDDVIVSFLTPMFDKVYRIVVGAYVTTGQPEANLTIGAAGEITLDSSATGAVARLRIADFGEPSNAEVTVASLQGEAPQAFATAADWARAPALPDQYLATRAFAVIAAPNVGIETISMADLAAIYAGDIKNWSELGGPDLAVLPLQLPTTSTVRTEFIKLVMDPAGKAIAGNVLTMSDGISIASSVNQFSGSLSVVELADAAENNILSVSGSCGAPVQLNTFNVISGDYPLVRPLMIRFDETPQTDLTFEVFDFAAGDIAQRLISAEGFDSLAAVGQSEDAKNRRLNQLLGATFENDERLAAAQMFQRLFEAQRLSPTMFGGATSGPEAGWNRAMFKVLADVLATSDMAGREVIFAGFGAHEDGALAALSGSAAAAADMKEAFLQFAPNVVATNGLVVSSHGFGGISPATCYEGQVAASGHNRVEVWVK